MLYNKQDTFTGVGGYVYHFMSAPYSYIEQYDGPALPLAIPSTTEAATMLAEYQEWAQGAGQSEYSALTSLLTSIEGYKAPLLACVDSEAAAFESNLNKAMYFTSSLGFKVNGDRRTKDNLQDLITFFDLQAQEGTIEYRDYDNVDRKLTKEQLQTLLVEHVANGQGLYTQKWAMQQAINAAKTFEDLQAVSLEFKMLDFSKKSQLPKSVRLGLEKSSSID